MSELRKTIDDITRLKSILDGTERFVGRDSSGDFRSLISSFVNFLEPYTQTLIDATVASIVENSYAGVVNTVHIGKRTSSVPDFLTFSNLYVGIDTNAGDDPLRLNVANGRSNTGLQTTRINILDDIAADGSGWTVDSTDGTYQLFIDEDGSYSVAAVDTFYTAGTIEPSGSSGDNFFDINANIMRNYTSGWADLARTPVGEAIVSGGAITSVICYAFNGKFETDYQTMSAAATTTINHNLGYNVEQIRGIQLWKYTGSSDSGYNAGDILPFPLNPLFTAGNFDTRGIADKLTRNTVVNREASLNNVYLLNFTTGGAATQIGTDRLDWDYKYILERGF